MSGFDFDSEYQSFCRYAVRIACGLGLDKSEGVAAVHDTWLKMAEGKKTLGEHAGAFYLAIRNLLIDKWRRERVCRSLDPSFGEDQDFAPSTSDRLITQSDRVLGRHRPTAEDKLIGRESLALLTLVAEALDSLSPKKKVAVQAKIRGKFAGDPDGEAELRNRYGLDLGGYCSLADLAAGESADLNKCIAPRASRGADALEEILIAAGLNPEKAVDQSRSS